MGKDGTLYYTNDSGYLFALKRRTSGSVSFDAQDGSSINSNPGGFGGGAFFGTPSAAIGSPASNANVASSSAAPVLTQQVSDQKEDSAGTSGSLLGQHGNTSNSQQADGHSESDNAGSDVSSSENSSLPSLVIPIIGIIAGVVILIAAFHNSNKKRTHA